MDFSEYQKQAAKTDKLKKEKGDDRILVPLLGLGGEVGSLLTEYKKRLRDGENHKLFKQLFVEELGDILWYLTTAASKYDIDLTHIAEENLKKIKERWVSKEGGKLEKAFFDEDFPLTERFPRNFTVEFKEEEENSRKVCKIYFNGSQAGDPLTDNAYEDDGYRYHDIFHIANAVFLGWSPVLRGILKCKRKSNKTVDEIEDGARAGIIEEAVSAFVYSNAKQHNMYRGTTELDYDLLKTIKRLVSDLEVNIRSTAEWEKTILEAYNIFRLLTIKNGGIVIADMVNKTLEYKNT